MKTKSFRYGKVVCKSYIRAVGKGWECGFDFNGKTIFVGNFVHHPEATHWFSLMNKEIVTIGRKYTQSYKFPITWLQNLIGHTLYKTYYTFLDKVFAKHVRFFNTASSRDLKKFRHVKHTLTKQVKGTYLKAA